MFGIFGKRKPLRIKSDPVTVTVTREVWDSTKEAWVPASRWDPEFGRWEPALDLSEHQPFGHVTWPTPEYKIWDVKNDDWVETTVLPPRKLDMSEFRPVNPSTLYDAEGNVVNQWPANDQYERVLTEIVKVLDKTQATIMLDGLNVWENL